MTCISQPQSLSQCLRLRACLGQLRQLSPVITESVELETFELGFRFGLGFISSVQKAADQTAEITAACIASAVAHPSDPRSKESKQGLSKVRSKIKDGLCFNSISVEWIDYINSMWFVTRSAWFDEKWEMTELPDQTRLWFVSYSWNSLHSTIIHLFIWLTLCRSQPCQPGLMKSDVCQDTFPAILSMAVGGGTCCNPGDKGHCSNSPANCWYWIFPMLFKVSWHHTAAVTMGSSVQNPSEMAVGKLAVAKNNR